MNIAKIMIAGAAALALAACKETQPISFGETGNPTIRAELIANVDGCRVWRLNPDSGTYIFMTRCPGTQSAQMQWTESCGKNCVRTVQNIAANREDGR